MVTDVGRLNFLVVGLTIFINDFYYTRRLYIVEYFCDLMHNSKYDYRDKRHIVRFMFVCKNLRCIFLFQNLLAIL